MNREELLAKANAGDVEAVAEVANSYFRGLNDFDEDNDKAYMWLLKSEQMDPNRAKTLSDLGLCYIYGYGTEIDYAKGITYFRKAAELGYLTAQYRLAKQLEAKNDSECVYWYKKAAEQNDGDALYKLYEIYKGRKNGELDDTIAVGYLKRAAEVGNADAMYDLGEQYLGKDKGGLLERDPIEYLNWTRKAADAGNAAAMVSLALCYKGDSQYIGIVEVNISAAIEWAKKAAEKGLGKLLYLIACEYKYGDGSEQSRAKALELFRFGAEQGNASCMNELAWYELGWSNDSFSAVDPQKARAALEWAKKAGRIGDKTAFLFISEYGNQAYGKGGAEKTYFETAKAGADDGYYYCMFELYRCYKQGYGVEQNQEKAVEYLQAAANGDLAEALCILAILYSQGMLGLEVDHVKAFELYKRAAEKGNPDAYFSLAVYYENGKGGEQNIEKAIQYYQMSSDNKHDFASEFCLGIIYLSGSKIERDYAKSLEHIEKAYSLNSENDLVNKCLTQLYSDETCDDIVDHNKAKAFFMKKANAGDADAMYQVARHIGIGEAISDEAILWLKKAAHAGSVDAQFKLGFYYQMQKKDAKEAVNWLEMGAAQEHVGCLNILADILKNGANDIPADQVKAFEYYSKAAGRGNVYAMCNMGWCYFYGRGTARSVEEAVKCFEMGAARGDVHCLNILADILINGDDGVAANPSKAFEYFSKAAEQGDAYAVYNKGRCYLYGKGTVRDYDKAFALLNKVREMGYKHMWSELGCCYQDGYGTPINISLAIDCYKHGIEDDNCPICQLKLGEIYLLGKGVVSDNNLVRKYLLPLADGNNNIVKGDANYALGFSAKNDGNTQEMIYRWKKAAKNGITGAYTNLGEYYCHANDFDTAKYYLNIAASQGDENAKELLISIRQLGQQQNSRQHTEPKINHSSGGCYIATCVYGSYNCPEVCTLRRYRDFTLAKTWHGRTFIKVYYFVSPKVIKLFGKLNWFKRLWKGTLDSFVGKLQNEGFEDTPYNDLMQR